MHGRSEADWDQLADAGLPFLLERARLGNLNSYTELHATLERRTGLLGFDFGRADERAAMGHLLYLVVERNRPTTGRMISAWSPTWTPTTRAQDFMLSPATSACFPMKPPLQQSCTSGKAGKRAAPVLLAGLHARFSLMTFLLKDSKECRHSSCLVRPCRRRCHSVAAVCFETL